MTTSLERDDLAAMTGPADPAELPPFRRALVVIAAVAALGTMVELALIGHWHGGAQLVPWAVAWATLTAAMLTDEPSTPHALAVGRLLSGTNLVACAWGSLIHFQANHDFAAEIAGDAGPWSVLLDAARGRIPLLAPLVLGLPSVLILLAGWPSPNRRRKPTREVGERRNFGEG